MTYGVLGILRFRNVTGIKLLEQNYYLLHNDHYLKYRDM